MERLKPDDIELNHRALNPFKITESKVPLKSVDLNKVVNGIINKLTADNVENQLDELLKLELSSNAQFELVTDAFLSSFKMDVSILFYY